MLGDVAACRPLASIGTGRYCSRRSISRPARSVVGLLPTPSQAAPEEALVDEGSEVMPTLGGPVGVTASEQPRLDQRRKG
eukprot:scaffold32308_cov90-Isochrysis_galbana.AAC.1